MRLSAISLCIASLGLLRSQTSVDVEQQVQKHLERARTFLGKQQSDLAIGEFQQIIQLDPNNADAHANRGVLIFFSGDVGGAEADLSAALKLKPDLWKVEALLGLCEKRLNKTASARDHLARAIPHLEDEKLRVRAGLELAESQYADGDLDDAASTVAGVRRLRPTDPDVLYLAHRVYVDLADECMLTAALAVPGSARTSQLRANELARRGKNTAAVAQYYEAIRLDPHLPDVHFQLAELLQSVSPLEQEEAKREYAKALADNSLNARAQSRLGEIALQASNLQEAASRFSSALAIKPDDSDANVGLARVLMARGQSTQAEVHLHRAAQSEPFNASTHMRLASLYRNQGRSADASRELAEFQKLKALKDDLNGVYLERHSESMEVSKPQ